MTPLHWLKRWYWPARMALQRRRRQVRRVAAYVWRRLLFRTTFLVVAGSVGKTTTKELLAAILQRHAPTARTPGNCNHSKFGGPEATLLSVRPWHRFAVIEAGIERPDDMAAAARLLKPDVALMLDVKRCHTNVFKHVEAIAEEKGRLLEALRPSAIAVINQDNPLVVAMLDRCHAHALAFGRSSDAQIRLLEAHCRWPGRLELSVEAQGERYEIRTRLVGEHWASSVLAALSAAGVCGVPLPEAIRTMETIEPFWARMQPVTLPGSGAVLIRDEWNGSIDTFDAAFAFLAQAQAQRKIIISSDYSDSPAKLRARANRLARRVAAIADMAVFVGEYAARSAATALNEGMRPDQVRSFVSLSAATEFLKQHLRHGDLALLKRQANHHLSRIYLGLLGPVSCNTLSCSRQFLCDRCDQLGMEWRPEFDGVMARPEAFV